MKKNHLNLAIKISFILLVFYALSFNLIIIFLEANDLKYRDLWKWWLHSLSYFTNQSNILAFIYMFIALINHKKEVKTNKITCYNYLFFSTIYITLTCLMCFIMLLPFALTIKDNNLESGQTWTKIVNSILLHLVSPSLFIAYYFYNCGAKIIFWRKTNFFHLPIMLAYPMIYTLFIFVLPEIVSLERYDIEIKDWKPIKWFQYQTINYEEHHILIVIGSAICVFLTLFLIFYTYIYFNNYFYFKKNKLDLLKPKLKLLTIKE